MAKQVSGRYVANLLRLVRGPSLGLNALKKHWPDVQEESRRKRDSLDRKIPEDDPIRLPLDLLTPLNQVYDETVHTRALAYLLTPSSGHGFRNAILRSIVKQVKWDHSRRSEVASVHRLLADSNVRIDVTPEYRYEIVGCRERSIARPDIWIVLQSPTQSALVVIENKINACESTGQLGWYEQKARHWRKHQRSGAISLLIFLSLDQHEVESSDSGEWTVLSYVELAAALRNVWHDKRRAPGRQWLGLYIASIIRGLLGVDISSTQGAELKQIQTYLGETS